MTKKAVNGSTHTVQITRVTREGREFREDRVAQEEPLEIRIDGRPVAITMRTPGHDLELAAGFLYTEGVIDGVDDIRALAHVDDPADPQGNTVDTVLSGGVPAARRSKADRALFASSSCGVCGKASIDRLLVGAPPLSNRIKVDPDIMLDLPNRLRQAQSVFDQTGGLHAAALFDPTGEIEVTREDIGRHNAVDKVIGWRLREDRVPIDDRILLVSGRAGFEIIQKALVARIGVVAAVGAPSSMAVQLAEQSGMTLVGFLRDGRYNQYGGHQ
ncbi:MAG: sulfurtransferase FdhD [Deltaproteobacteria bacterium]|nr:sulfurtransferase FdhD [Deltaproteobacteria bacterium]|tara:strand:- start:30 stop:845 length:816 start_codon:yes stop_codon:yes gene_type:complete